MKQHLGRSEQRVSLPSHSAHIRGESVWSLADAQSRDDLGRRRELTRWCVFALHGHPPTPSYVPKTGLAVHRLPCINRVLAAKHRAKAMWPGACCETAADAHAESRHVQAAAKSGPAGNKPASAGKRMNQQPASTGRGKEGAAADAFCEARSQTAQGLCAPILTDSLLLMMLADAAQAATAGYSVDAGTVEVLSARLAAAEAAVAGGERLRSYLETEKVHCLCPDHQSLNRHCA